MTRCSWCEREATAEAAKAAALAESCAEEAAATHRRIAEALRLAPVEAVALLQAEARGAA